MRVRDHLALSTAAAALLHPLLGRRALGLWAGGVLIDADHYAWFCARERSLSPLAAMRYFGRPHPLQDPASRALHSRGAIAGALLVSLRHEDLLPIALGMTAHVALDVHHRMRMARARAAALARDRHSCRSCGTTAAELGTHLWRQPLLLPRYSAENLVTLCHGCHEAAHERRGGRTWS
jgi:hypothetical protein